ncbi:receptor-transporting protein 4-like [Hyla sarda]|uniref:receptor-transporting protein 4-like n=1 Tax=Hyla sarda TaxID=327740 RepID=UPI0024C3B264|nr:receptor-transporting protein 4-like [Hyla sarda]XP_056421450.1 receptor-transporting protein 4-like [Hyla sarda]XP_056421451.1 receptor-transporting protein 4-like [Hyla sarda]XP_056421452.1 receptor-transporting protein 4-like [Hyla sarda]XP_056421453.1 receptor-transporting protein 4-like [Hyla sarda]XP_056421454.1 receptor-transporting protein 4-like [Hyla sarda]
MFAIRNDRTWIEKFADEIEESEVPDTWSLNVDTNLQKNTNAKYFSQNTFGSFQCFYCKRKWNSSKVFILFRMVLNKYQKYGIVTMRIFKQGCQSCGSNTMQEPIISYENGKRVISNVVSHIQKVFYGKRNVNDDYPPNSYGKQEGPHDKEHCEACKFNLCDSQQTTSPQETGVIVGGVLSALLGVGALALMYLAKD